MKRVPHLETVVENYKKSEKVINTAMNMMKDEISNYLQAILENIRTVDP